MRSNLAGPDPLHLAVILAAFSVGLVPPDLPEGGTVRFEVLVVVLPAAPAALESAADAAAVPEEIPLQVDPNARACVDLAAVDEEHEGAEEKVVEATGLAVELIGW